MSASILRSGIGCIQHMQRTWGEEGVHVKGGGTWDVVGGVPA